MRSVSFSLFLAIGFLCTIVHSTPDELEKYNDQFRFSLELELGPSEMMRQYDQFNFEELIQKIPFSFYSFNDEQKKRYSTDLGIENVPRHELLEQLWALAGGVSLLPSAPEPMKALLSKMDLEADSSVFEFKYRDDVHVTKPTELLSDLRQLARYFGVEKEVFNWKNDTASYHFHVSRKGKPIPDYLLKLYNYSLMLDALEVNPTGVLDDKLIVAYQRDTTRKGLIRRHGPDRVELRFHSLYPKEELERVLRLLSMGDKAAARELAIEINRKMYKKNVDILALFKPSVLEDYLDSVAPYSKEQGPTEYIKTTFKKVGHATTRWQRLRWSNTNCLRTFKNALVGN